MSQIDKLKKRILSIPADFKYSEAKRLLCSLGYNEYTKGKTSGSRVMFFRQSDGDIIMLHKPHPGDEMKKSCVREVVEHLKVKGDL